MKAIILALLLAGCAKHTFGPDQYERAKIVDLPFIPAGHGSGSGVTVGNDSSGNVTVGPTFTTIDIPERYAVVFECAHGRFVVSGDHAAAIWKRFHLGDSVTVKYRVRIDDGKAVGLDFLDATRSAP